MSIVFVGGGNMASALIGGLIAHGQPAEDVRVVEIHPEAAERLRKDWGIQTYDRLSPVVEQAGTLVLAVKPQQLHEVAAALPPLSPDVRVISVAAGIRTDSLSRWLHGHANIVRAMPNTPALVRQGVAGLYAMSGVSEEDRLHAQSLLRAVGSVVWVEKESDLDALTAVSGSGPAYVFYFMEVMLKAALSLGLNEKAARLLVQETVLGAAQLAKASPDGPETLRRKVTSPGGTTEAAIAVFERSGLESIVIEALQAASRRSCELGDSLDRE
ncbi:MAG: pyrroline-5-carboxylate reductase [Betaproteobacteria bacterium]|nr:pyrroline-5-carboxylate reductase [Betaproteobacteria bacterium]